MKKYHEYAETECPFVHKWIDTTLAAHIDEHGENPGEHEHVLDYLTSDAAPKRIGRMSYEQAHKAAEKWLAALKKKGADIVEAPEDTETVHTFANGWRVVRLVGENAFKREGFLMSHCVASYAGREDIYSLRDPSNMPHATMQDGEQVKGKGNGPICHKYVDMVVEFLESRGHKIRESELQNLGFMPLNDAERKFVLKHFPDCRFFRGAAYVEDLA